MSSPRNKHPYQEKALEIVALTLLGAMAVYVAVDTTINADVSDPQPTIARFIESH